MRRNIVANIDERPLTVYNYSVQRSVDSFWINNTKKPQQLVSNGVFRYYQTDPTNYYGVPSPFVIGSAAESSPVNNNYVKYVLNGQEVSVSNYINNFTPCLSSYFGDPQNGNYVEIKSTFTNPTTSYYYYNPNQIGYGNSLKSLPTDSSNIFVCLSTTTSLELLAGQHKIYIPIKLAYYGLNGDDPVYSEYQVQSYLIYSNLTAFNMSVKDTLTDTVSSYTLSAYETLGTFTSAASSFYFVTPLGYVPSLCATIIKTTKVNI